nr:MAG TPA: protein of unknown function UPF0560 [Caudoviricetes sp.]
MHIIILNTVCQYIFYIFLDLVSFLLYTCRRR